MRKSAASPGTTEVPHDWTFGNWPPGVYPYDGVRGRHVVRQNLDELLHFKALTRIGKKIVILGAGYAAWLLSNQSRVKDFDVPANRPEHAAKRFGGRDAKEVPA